MEKCTLKFPDGFIPAYKDIFCQLQKAQSAFPWSEYEKVAQARTEFQLETEPRAFRLDTGGYTNHPTEVYINATMTPLDRYSAAATTKIGVGYVENIGNGDQGSFWNSNAKYGNLYLLTSPGKCQDLSPQVEHTSWRWNSFDEALRGLAYAQHTYNGYSPEPGMLGFPKSVAEAKQTLPVMVTILPGPSATHVPDGQDENSPNAIKQGEWPLAWSTVTYAPAKPADLVSESLPREFASTPDRCSRVVQGHGSSTPIIQFTWSTADIMRSGALTVAHDINNFKAVLRNEAAKSTPSVFKITLVKM